MLSLYKYWLWVATLLVLISSCTSDNKQGETQEKAINESIDVVESEESFDLGDFQKLVETYEDPERGIWQNPDFVLKSLGNIKGKTIADIGAGTGYFTFRIAAKGARVVAIDIDERFLEYIEDRKNELQLTLSERIEIRLSQENDPLLQPEEVNVALLVNTYHFIENRVDYLRKVRRGLVKNGTVVIVDYKMEETPSGPDDNFRVSAETVSKELKEAGFSNITTNSTDLKFQYLITAKTQSYVERRE